MLVTTGIGQLTRRSNHVTYPSLVLQHLVPVVYRGLPLLFGSGVLNLNLDEARQKGN